MIIFTFIHNGYTQNDSVKAIQKPPDGFQTNGMIDMIRAVSNVSFKEDFLVQGELPGTAPRQRPHLNCCSSINHM